jgi:TolB-like protein/DNA-binding winged helix-turn-helix (wHTH) protein/Tfp pilus assembly protein PilF
LASGGIVFNIVRFGGEFELDVGAYELRRAGQPLKLARIPMELLLLLVDQPGQLVTREQIVERVWGKNVFLDTDNGINAVIRRIRQVLEDDPEQPRFIQTVVGRGYRFIADVDEIIAPSPSISVRDPQAPENSLDQRDQLKAISEKDPQPQGSQSKTGILETGDSMLGRSGRMIVFGTLIVLLVIAAMIPGLWSSRNRARLESIAVLPFVNTTGDPDIEYLSDGITEGIINELSQLPRMQVIARSTVFHYKGHDADPKRVGRELGVPAVLTGTMVRHGDEVRVQAELVDVSNGSELWGEHYNRKVSDLAGVQQEIVRDVFDRLKVQVSSEERDKLRRRTTESWEAYDLYLRGRYQWNKFSPDSLHKAIAYFEQAIDKDPTYALAYAGLADAYHELSYSSPPGEVMPKARAAANKALELDDSVAEAHAALGWVKWQYEWDWAGAEKEFQRSIQLSPNYAIAHGMYALYLDSMSRVDEARAQHKRAQELEPLSLIISTNAGEAFYQMRQYDQAIEQFRKTLELDEKFAPAREGLAAAFERKGMRSEAIAEWQKSFLADGDPGTAMAIGQAYSISGYEGAIRTWLEHLTTPSDHAYVSPFLVATLYARLGARHEALAWLAKATEDRSSDLVFLKVEPEWDDLRSDPRYLEATQKIGFSR